MEIKLKDLDSTVTKIKEQAKRNILNRRVSTIITLIDRYGRYSNQLRNYISDCMESDIRRERKRIETEHPIIVSGYLGKTERKEK